MSQINSRSIEFLSDILQVEIARDIEDLSREECEEWDSINHLRLIMELEEFLSISIGDEDAMELSSLRQVDSLLNQHGLPEEGAEK